MLLSCHNGRQRVMGARQTVEFTGGVSRSTAMHKRKRLSRNEDLVPVGSPLRTSRDLPCMCILCRCTYRYSYGQLPARARARKCKKWHQIPHPTYSIACTYTANHLCIGVYLQSGISIKIPTFCAHMSAVITFASNICISIYMYVS